MQNNSSSNNTNSKTSFGYHDGEVETVISVDDVNRQAKQIAEKVSIEKISVPSLTKSCFHCLCY